MAKFKKHWRRWILVGIAIDCVTLLFGHRLFGAANVTIATAQSLEALDGSPLDADGQANGIFTVGGNLTLAPGGRITCAGKPAGGGPCAVRVAVGGNLEMLPASAIVSGIEGGSGGRVELAVGGNFTMRGARGRERGARISAGDDAVAAGGAIDIFAVGKVTTEPGSAIASDARVEGGEIAIAGASTDVRGAVSARATTASGRPGAVALASNREDTSPRS